MKKLDISVYSVKAPVRRKITAAVISDLHGEEYDYILDEVRKRKSNFILIPGDVTHSHISTPENCGIFFKDCKSLAPVFMSYGNHENNSHRYVKEQADKNGIILLDNEYIEYEGIIIGGLTSGFLYYRSKKKQSHFMETPAPDLNWLQKFEELDGFKLLLCHHPEYYPKYLKNRSIDLILSGHAHGGQWRIFGHPLFAPGQRFFPKYAQGITDGRLIVSRGLANNGPAPRFFNNRELIFIDFIPE